MKKLILFLTLLFINILYSQSILKDPSFANNGVYTLPVGSEYLGELTDNLSSVFYKSSDANTNNILISKTTNYNGSLDSSFGNNGIVSLNYSSNDLVDFLRHPDDKLNLLFNRYDAINNINYLDVVQLLPNGQLDTTFSNNGIKTFSNYYNPEWEHSSFLKLQGSKILVSADEVISGGITTNYTHTFRLNADGSLDTSFGNNGELVESFKSYPFLDNQNNIIIISTDTITKYTVNGQLMTSFGNNGEVPLSDDVYSPIRIDSNNRILYSNIFSLSGPDSIKRINADGTPDTTFNFSGTVSINEISDIYEKNGYYYILGVTDVNGPIRYYISRLQQNGSLDSTFGEYIEDAPGLDYHYTKKIKVFDNSIFVSGGEASSEIVKYLLNTATLSSLESGNKKKNLIIENPVNDEIKFISKEEIAIINIYTPNAKLVKKLQNNATDVSDLKKGVYFLQINFKNGRAEIAKIIKK